MSRSAQSSGDRLRELRVAAGLSAAELARMADVAPNTILNAERGSTPTPAFQRAISDALLVAFSRPVVEADAQLRLARERRAKAQRKIEQLWPVEAVA